MGQTGNSSPAIRVESLRKTYRNRAGTVEAARGVSFDVAHGEVFALLGPNGAGKTTTLEILEGSLARDSGTVRPEEGEDLPAGDVEADSARGFDRPSSVAVGLAQALDSDRRRAVAGLSHQRFPAFDAASMLAGPIMAVERTLVTAGDR